MPPHEHDHGHDHGRKGPPRKGPPGEGPARKGPPPKLASGRHGRHVPSSAITAFVDEERVSRLLAPWVPDPGERAFVVRCLLREGPAHHRGANFVLLSLLGLLVEPGGPPAVPQGEGVEVPLRLPPHLAEEHEDGAFPLRMPTGPIERLASAGTPEFEAMVDCLTDGPPQHALANAAMVALLGVLLERTGR